MTLTQEGRGVIRLGDATTHGGKVVSAAHTTATVMGIPIACVGDLTQCPKCKGVYPIVEGDATDTINGVPTAYHGHKTACGAALISSI